MSWIVQGASDSRASMAAFAQPHPMLGNNS
jgi:hypothetical protein